jgi:hypothetical protein
MKTTLSLLIVVVLLLMGARYWRQSQPTKSTPKIVMAIAATNTPSDSAACAAAAEVWKAKYDSLHAVWTEARERIFTKQKYKKRYNSHEQTDSLGAI